MVCIELEDLTPPSYFRDPDSWFDYARKQSNSEPAHFFCKYTSIKVISDLDRKLNINPGSLSTMPPPPQYCTRPHLVPNPGWGGRYIMGGTTWGVHGIFNITQNRFRLHAPRWLSKRSEHSGIVLISEKNLFFCLQYSRLYTH